MPVNASDSSRENTYPVNKLISYQLYELSLNDLQFFVF